MKTITSEDRDATTLGLVPLNELQGRKAALEHRHRVVLDQICALRQLARDKALAAQTTRQAIAQSEIDHWQVGIREAQQQLMTIQSELGSVNKTIRATHARESAKGSNGNAPTAAGGNLKDDDSKRLLWLECFRQIVEGSVDPRQYKAFTDGVRSLLADHHRMHGAGGN
jgi:hypothetical protein